MDDTESHLTRLPLAGQLVSEHFGDWTPELREEMQANEFNGVVGQTLLLHNDSVRIWSINLPPGQRLPFHRHVLDYFWTALKAGQSRQRTHDGTTREVSYHAGETRFYRFGRDEYLLHNLENTGASNLEFITVELIGGDNEPLPLGETVIGDAGRALGVVQ